MIDLSRWLAPLDGENPSGAGLRNEPRFHDLERLLEPKVEVVRDERNNPSAQIIVPVDWDAALSIAEELHGKGRDLRLLVLVVRGWSDRDGLAGLASGLTLLAQTLERYWDTVHPELRQGGSPQEAALRRTNALLQLQNAEDGVLGDLRRTSFLSPRGIGPVTGRDLEQGGLDERTMLNEAASGLNATERAALAGAHEQLVNRVRTACAAHADQNADDMARLQADARAALAALGAVEAQLASRLGAGRAAAPDLKRFLERLLSTLERSQGAQRKPASTPEAQEGPLMPIDATPAASLAHAGANGLAIAQIALPDRLNSRDDVVKCLDLVVAFYDRTEPSSPIPHLARRIRKMVHMDFVELMEDIAPSGLKEFRLLAGLQDAKKQ